MTGFIEMVEARAVKPGDVFSTDGGVVVLSEYRASLNMYRITCIAQGVEKTAVFNANEELPIWRRSS